MYGEILENWARSSFGSSSMSSLPEARAFEDQEQLECDDPTSWSVLPLDFANFSRCSSLGGQLKDHPELELGRGQKWRPAQWQPKTLYRALWICRLAPERRRLALMEELFRTADLGESVDLYRCLPLCEESPALGRRLEEGIRSNVPESLMACLYHSPLSERLLDQRSWNHMVLKMFHMDLSLVPIIGRQRRSNDALDLELLRYASERSYGNRAVPEALWDEIRDRPSQRFTEARQRLVDTHTNGRFLAELKERYG